MAPMTQRARLMLAAGASALALLLVAVVRGKDWVLYNDSPSVPVGFYLRSNAEPGVGAFVTVRARDVASAYAAQRGFTDDGDRFIKRIAAGEGEEVCARGDAVTVGGRTTARAVRDSAGRALPRWEGCHILHRREFFLLGDTSDSFDSRYFGIVQSDQIEGVWRPL